VKPLECDCSLVPDKRGTGLVWIPSKFCSLPELDHPLMKLVKTGKCYSRGNEAETRLVVLEDGKTTQDDVNGTRMEPEEEVAKVIFQSPVITAMDWEVIYPFYRDTLASRRRWLIRITGKPLPKLLDLSLSLC
jgi:hypothetical protein